MRRVFVAVSILIGLASVLSAQSITVTKPALNETWVKGQNYAIQWTSSGQLPNQVKIQLRNAAATAVILDIVDPAPNSGSYQWAVPASVADGQYRIRVKAKGVDISGDSQLFNIAVAPPPPAGTITVTKPTAADTWVKGQPYSITWAQTGNLPNQVVISLMNSGATTVVKTLADPASNNGSYQGTVPADVAPDSYKVRVQAKGTQVLGDSQIFNIAAAAPAGSITVTKPNQADTWLETQTYSITWTKTGSLPDQVTINLIDKSAPTVVRSIADPAPNSGSYSWKIPGDLVKGQYRVRVKAKNTETSGDSQVFSIGLMKPPAVAVSMAASTKVLEFPATYQNMSHFEYQFEIQPPSSFWTGRPHPCAGASYDAHAIVGYDDFAYHKDGGTTWCKWYHHAKVYFQIDSLKGQGSKLLEAKMKVKQVDAVRRNTSQVSCANNIFAFLGLWTDWNNFKITPWIAGLCDSQADYSIDITDTVKKWLDGTLVNYGLLLTTNYEYFLQREATCVSCLDMTLVLTFKAD